MWAQYSGSQTEAGGTTNGSSNCGQIKDVVGIGERPCFGSSSSAVIIALRPLAMAQPWRC
jgi:hypothetical protein